MYFLYKYEYGTFKYCTGVGTSWGGQKERVKEGEYGGIAMYSCMKMER
jgi:hypothetical protein